MLLSRRFSRLAWLPIACAVILGIVGVSRLALAANASARRHDARPNRLSLAAVGQRWIASWGAAPQLASPRNAYANGFADQTVRNIVVSQIGGTMLRVRLTNAFGTKPLVIGRAAVASDPTGTSNTSDNHQLTFSGRPSVTIPPGGVALSDPVALSIGRFQPLAISLFLPGQTGPPTLHGQGLQVNYVAQGDHALDSNGSAFGAKTQSWYFLEGIDVLSPEPNAGVIVALGDSITDGVGSTTGANARWPNDLARRLATVKGPTMSVIDEGIGGNRILNASPCCGTSAERRFHMDVSSVPNARDVILLEGINDIGFSQSRGALNAPHTDVSAEQIIAGDEEIIRQAHAAGLRIFGATLTPFQGARYWTPAGEAKREAVNQWILTSGAFDGTIDFAAALADPSDPLRLNPAYDSGDHLHPNDAGYRAMANSIDLAALLHG